MLFLAITKVFGMAEDSQWSGSLPGLYNCKGITGTCISPPSFLLNKDMGPAVPLVVYYKFIGLTDIKVQVLIITPCDEALSQSSVHLCRNSLSEDSMFLTEYHTY